jgi:hypothetical protein
MSERSFKHCLRAMRIHGSESQVHWMLARYVNGPKCEKFRGWVRLMCYQIFKQEEFEGMFNEQVEKLKASGEGASNGN